MAQPLWRDKSVSRQSAHVWDQTLHWSRARECGKARCSCAEEFGGHARVFPPSPGMRQTFTCLRAHGSAAVARQVSLVVSPLTCGTRCSAGGNARGGGSVVMVNITFFQYSRREVPISRASDIGLTCRLDLYNKHRSTTHSSVSATPTEHRRSTE